MFALTVDTYEKPSLLKPQQGWLMYVRVLSVIALTREMQLNCVCKHEWRECAEMCRHRCNQN